MQRRVAGASREGKGNGVEQGAPGFPEAAPSEPEYFPYMIRPLVAGAAGLEPERIMKTWQVMGSGDLERGAEGRGTEREARLGGGDRFRGTQASGCEPCQ